MPLADLPVDCLQGRLGDICTTRFKHFPRAYAWITLLTAASSVIDQPDNDPHVNLYGCVVGGVHTGKSQAIKSAIKALGIETPTLVKAYSGSAEAFARSMDRAMGNPRLWQCDELGFLLQKAHIEHSTIPQVLSTAFDDRQVTMNMGKQKTTELNCSLSIIGGMVEDSFSDFWGKQTTGGLYDRFIFGLCPSDFEFDYEPMNGAVERVERRAGDVLLVDPEIWQWAKHFKREHKDKDVRRLVEIGIRSALICAYFDNSQLVDLKRLDPHIAFIEYQARMREFLKPNPGENFEAQLQHKFLAYLRLHPGFISKYLLFRDTHAYDKGLSVAERALDMLVANNDVHRVKIGNRVAVRLSLPSEIEGGEEVPKDLDL